MSKYLNMISLSYKNHNFNSPISKFNSSYFLSLILKIVEL